MKRVMIVLLFTTFLIYCSDKKYVPKDLIKLTDEQLLQRARDKQYPDISKVIFKTEFGEVIPLDNLKKNYDPAEWIADYYIDANQKVKELVYRKATEQDKKLKLELRKAYEHYEPIALVEVDCQEVPELLQQVFDTDQEMRNGQKDWDAQVDRKNLAIVISIIEKCGMPTRKEITEIQMSAVWLVFQHGDNSNRKKYLPLLEKAVENKDLKATTIAMMKDRVLMMDGEPQIYGTQVVQEKGEWVLYDLADPETVNKRRKVIGFGTLEDYLKRWDIEFKVQQRE